MIGLYEHVLSLTWNKLVHFCLLLFMIGASTEHVCNKQNSKVAIVGAGIGGAATSYFLSELLQKEGICVDIYEANAVGGRLSTVLINGSRYDSGGTVIHEGNYYMSYFKDKLDLKRRKFNFDGTIGLYNGKEFIPMKESWSSVSLLKGIWRYGFQFLNIDGYVEKILSKFGRIYDFQKEMQSFDTTHDMLQSLDQDLPNYLTVSIKDALIKEGFSELLINEVIGSAVYRDFNLGTSVHQFLGTIALAISQPQLWAVEGGNHLVVEALIKESNPNEIDHSVQEIHLNTDGSFKVLANNVSKNYNFVVIATPITKDHSHPIAFKQFPKKIEDSGHFHLSISTIVHGKVNYKYFGLSHVHELPNVILNTGGSFFNSITQILPVDSKVNQIKDVYKVISHKPLTTQQIDDLFLEKSEVQVVDWLANPYYDTNQRNDSFVLYQNLFYINAIEWVSSGMEMSCISAKNIALLIYKSLFPQIKSQTEPKLSKSSVNNEL